MAPKKGLVSYKNNTQKPLQIQENALWSQNVTGCLPDEDGPYHGEVPWSHQYPRWHSGLWHLWGEDHDANLINLLNVAQVEGLVLNSKKLELKCPRVSFFGAEYSIEGMHPCLKKIQGKTEMTPPHRQATAGQFHRSGHIHGELCATPVPSHWASPGNAETGGGLPLGWNCKCHLPENKGLDCQISCPAIEILWITKPVTVQADASQRGLIACLLQDGQPTNSSSTRTSWEGPSQWSQTTSHWKW